MLSSPTSHENTNLFALAFARGVLVAGLCLLGVYILQCVFTIPTTPAIGAAVLIGGLVFFQDISHIAKQIEKVWRAEQDSRCARLKFETSVFTGQWELPAEPGEEAAPDQPSTDRLFHHRTLQGTYFTRDLTPAEVAEQVEIGECLRFLAVADKAGGYSVRLMAEKALPGYTAAQFEKWWTARTDQLVDWGLFEKSERKPTCPVGNRSNYDIRRALLRRDFRRTLPPPRAEDRQTDSQTAPEVGQGGGILQPALAQ